ncbi:MAG TPA: aspartate/glutamate racemase family protein [Bryobacteraceae bacterium]|nr:aspartate/glutamate racemase family protein [Bryobacteraceae bacterium]
MRNLGVIGGLGPGATVQYYQQLAKANPGEMLIVHADMDRVREAVERNDLDGLAGYLARLVERLAEGGAQVAAISAVTPHICIRRLERISVLPLVDITKAIAAEVRASGYRRIALFGTRFVVESRMFGLLDGIEVVVPQQVATIHDCYMRIVNGETEPRATLTRIAHELPVDAIVLAGTDLALVYNEANTDFPHVDCVRAHVRAILDALA